MSITRRIAQLVPLENVVEIGPGPGGLTRALLERAQHVYAIEKDSICIQALTSLKERYQDKLTLIEGDALSLNVFELQKNPFCIMANLPYNIGTALLIQWIQGLVQYDHLRSMTLMLQKEVVERIIAQEKTSSYGRLSILCQYACDVRKEFNVSASCFTPPPKVTSAVVTLIPKANKNQMQDLPLLENMTRIAFGNRRKMLRNTLGRHYPYIEMLQKEIRPETVTVREWIDMMESIKEYHHS